MVRPAKTSTQLTAATQRLLEVISDSELTRKEFAERIGITVDGLNKIFSRGSSISAVLAKAVQLEFGINQSWLIEGEGPKSVELWKKELPQLLLRLTPNFDAKLMWMCFEKLLDYSFISLSRLGKDLTGSNFKKYAEYVEERTEESFWLDRYFDQEKVYLSQLIDLKSKFFEVFNDSYIEKFDQTLVLKILMDGEELTEEMFSENVLKSLNQLHGENEIGDYYEKLKNFSESRRTLTRLLDPPMELKKDYVQQTNLEREQQEKDSMEERKLGQLLVNIPPFLRINEQGEVVEDILRQKIFHHKISISAQEYRKNKATPERIHHIEKKLNEMQITLKNFEEQWEKGGGDGTTD